MAAAAAAAAVGSTPMLPTPIMPTPLMPTPLMPTPVMGSALSSAFGSVAGAGVTPMRVDETSCGLFGSGGAASCGPPPPPPVRVPDAAVREAHARTSARTHARALPCAPQG
eukprot:5876944-Pleurochrysis_carterae.AAC.1